MIPTFLEIKDLVDKLAEKIQAPTNLLPAYGSANFDSQPFIDIDRSGLLFYLAKERGVEIMRYVAKDIDDLLYNVFEGVTFTMAVNYESANRVKGQDSRRIYFNERERLLGILNEQWKLRAHKEFEEILIKYPFDDFLRERVTYYQQLVAEGKNVGNEMMVAYQKYPDPNRKQ